MTLIKQALSLLSEHRKAYIGMNVLYYGLIVCCMLLVTQNPSIQIELGKTVDQGLKTGFIAPVVKAYEEGNIPLAAALTFLVNLTLGSFGTITLPSMVIPFSGLFMGCVRAVVWGLLFSPITEESRTVFFPHILILVMEGQAYILTMLTAWLHSKAFLFPETVSETTHGRGFVAGFRLTGRLYVLIAIVLAVSAVCEALEIPFFEQLKGAL